MLEVHASCKEHYEQAIDFAKKVGKYDDLRDKLDYLDQFSGGKNTKAVLYKDFAPYSFEFTMYIKNKTGEYREWFNGGLIFHGQHDGEGNGRAPTFSVCLTPCDGWTIHT